MHWVKKLKQLWIFYLAIHLNFVLLLVQLKNSRL